MFSILFSFASFFLVITQIFALFGQFKPFFQIAALNIVPQELHLSRILCCAAVIYFYPCFAVFVNVVDKADTSWFHARIKLVVYPSNEQMGFSTDCLTSDQVTGMSTIVEDY